MPFIKARSQDRNPAPLDPVDLAPRLDQVASNSQKFHFALKFLSHNLTYYVSVRSKPNFAGTHSLQVNSPTAAARPAPKHTVRDLYGYHLVFGYHMFNAGSPIKIERVDVPVRLEKRLAALLQDLANHKCMNIDGCLEKMLLHPNEGVGPHTKTTLHYIQELKNKHGSITTATPAIVLSRTQLAGGRWLPRFGLLTQALRNIYG